MTDDQNRYILHRLDEIHDDIAEVKKLAKETNGRVRTLELWKAKTEGARWVLGGAYAIGLAAFSSGFAVLLTTLIAR